MDVMSSFGVAAVIILFLTVTYVSIYCVTGLLFNANPLRALRIKYMKHCGIGCYNCRHYRKPNSWSDYSNNCALIDKVDVVTGKTSDESNCRRIIGGFKCRWKEKE